MCERWKNVPVVGNLFRKASREEYLRREKGTEDYEKNFDFTNILQNIQTLGIKAKHEEERRTYQHSRKIRGRISKIGTEISTMDGTKTGRVGPTRPPRSDTYRVRTRDNDDNDNEEETPLTSIRWGKRGLDGDVSNDVVSEKWW